MSKYRKEQNCKLYEYWTLNQAHNLFLEILVFLIRFENR